MSQLSPFVRAFRSLAKALHAEAERARFDSKERGEDAQRLGLGLALGLSYAAGAFKSAAFDLEQQIAADLSRTGPQS